MPANSREAQQDVIGQVVNDGVAVLLSPSRPLSPIISRSVPDHSPIPSRPPVPSRSLPDRPPVLPVPPPSFRVAAFMSYRRSGGTSRVGDSPKRKEGNSVPFGPPSEVTTEKLNVPLGNNRPPSGMSGPAPRDSRRLRLTVIVWSTCHREYLGGRLT